MKDPLISSRRVIFSVLLSLFSVGALFAQQAAVPPAPLLADFGDAGLRDWVQPVYPEAAKKQKKEGRVKVEFVVGLDGQVADATVQTSTNEIFNEAALTAVQRWRFYPALEEGLAVASGMEVTVVFRLAQLQQKRVPLIPDQEFRPQALKNTPAKFIMAPDPDYPEELAENRIPGEVLIEFTVDAAGIAGPPKVVWASHAAFVEMALRALEKSKIQPARQGPLRKATAMRYPVQFMSLGIKRAEILAANRMTLVGETKPDVEPTPFVLVEPVYPRERLLAGDEGTASAEFTVEPKGMVTEVKLMAASAPEYGAALLGAVQAWGFKPATTDGASVPVRLRVEYGFIPPISGASARLREALQPGGPGVGGAAGLDEKLKPLWRGFPVYPAELREEQVKGSALIEFIIDREGRVRLPRVKSATREEFGWAAATAISQWVFARPTRQGEPVDVTVAIPFDFNPPTQ